MKHINYKLEGSAQTHRIERYDRVLARNSDNEAWKEDVYWETNELALKRHLCLYGEYRFCIPMCDETKHLKGTSDKYDKFIEI